MIIREKKLQMMQHKENILPQPTSPAAFAVIFAAQEKVKKAKKIKRKSNKKIKRKSKKSQNSAY